MLIVPYSKKTYFTIVTWKLFKLHAIINIISLNRSKYYYAALLGRLFNTEFVITNKCILGRSI